MTPVTTPTILALYREDLYVSEEIREDPYKLELQVSSSKARLEKLGHCLARDAYFGPIVAIQCNWMPKLGPLSARNIKFWQKAYPRSRKFVIGDDNLLYRVVGTQGLSGQ
jgi:hypothetical protein